MSAAELLIEKSRSYVADDDFDKKRLRAIRLLKENGGELKAVAIRRSMHMSSRSFKELLDTLQDNEQVVVETVKTSRRPIAIVKLVS